jgi:hypothetical protein
LPHPGNPDPQRHRGRHRTVDTADELNLGASFAVIQALAATRTRRWVMEEGLLLALSSLAEHILTMNLAPTAVRTSVCAGRSRP